MGMLFDNILISHVEAKGVTESGIVLPDSEEKSQKSEVLMVGPDVKEVKEGDIVIHKRWAGDEVEIKGVRLHILKEEEVLATVE